MSSSSTSKRLLLPLLVVLIASLVVPAAFAQSATTGSIGGEVRDPSGAALPGMTVTVSSPNLIRPQSATTASDGRYTISNLPPGSYTIIVEAGKGFSKFEQRNVEVNLGRNAPGDIRLQVASAQTEITVAATAAGIDVASTTVGSNVNSDQFSYFPTARTVQGLYNIAPSVTRSGLRDASGRDRDPSVAGSSGPENNYILDGVNVSDTAFGGGGANLPFEFVQEVEVKTGAYSAEYGKSTGGIFNVVTKSGGNVVHGDIFGFFSSASLVRGVKNFPFTGSAANGFSDKDIGGDIGGPIKKDRLWFFGAVNPQWRTNDYLTQTFHLPVKNNVTIPFYAGKLTWAINNNNTFTFSTYGDFTKVDGFLATGALTNVSGFGTDPKAFQGTQLTGGQNYSFRLNSAITPKFIAEITGGLHFARNNSTPLDKTTPAIADSFSVLLGGAILPVTHSGVLYGATPTVGAANDTTGFIDYVDGRGGSLQRAYSIGPGFGLYQTSARNRYEINAHFQNTFSKHNLKWGFEWNNNIYNNVNTSSGGPITYGNPLGLSMATADSNATINQRITNSFSVCTTRGSQIVCPSSAATARLSTPGVVLPAGLTSVITAPITTAEAFSNPFLVRTGTRVRDFELHANTSTRVLSGYIQDDWKIVKNVQLNLGLRWDFQTSYGQGGVTYLKLNQFIPDTEPRLGLIWDFTGNGKGKLSISFARFLETPIPLDVNVRAGGGDSQTDKNFNVNTYGAPAGSTIIPGISSSNLTKGATNLGADATPVDPNLRPQTVNEYTAGFEYAVRQDIVLGVRGVYRNFVNIIEDGSFDDGNTYFLFNPGRRGSGVGTPGATTEDLACADPTVGCFGKARRYYRGIEFTATKRFTGNYQFIASYTYSSLVGNYEGLFRNDNGQSDPNITSLFDLVSLLKNVYGRLPNDRPHQLKFNGSYRTPFKLMISGNWYLQSGSPFNMLVPHVVYGNNEGFGVQRGTAIVPVVSATQAGFPNYVNSVGSTRTPLTWNTDLGFYYPIKVGEGKEIRVSADWFNVFNQQRAVTLDQTYSLNSGVTGVPPVVNPFWGSALLVQPPSQWRFGVKFSF